MCCQICEFSHLDQHETELRNGLERNEKEREGEMCEKRAKQLLIRQLEKELLKGAPSLSLSLSLTHTHTFSRTQSHTSHSLYCAAAAQKEDAGKKKRTNALGKQNNREKIPVPPSCSLFPP